MKQLSFESDDEPDWEEVGQLVNAVDRLDQTLRELIDVLREGFGLWIAGGKG